mmetsp:Transcript_10079/g.26116  ORF Transcript_10079/g.26116 Transcript_10079/m.26116 type:complete len:294 (+) Transcript_10079:330-1211(+)
MMNEASWSHRDSAIDVPQLRFSRAARTHPVRLRPPRVPRRGWPVPVPVPRPRSRSRSSARQRPRRWAVRGALPEAPLTTGRPPRAPLPQQLPPLSADSLPLKPGPRRRSHWPARRARQLGARGTSAPTLGQTPGRPRAHAASPRARAVLATRWRRAGLQPPPPRPRPMPMPMRAWLRAAARARGPRRARPMVEPLEPLEPPPRPPPPRAARPAARRAKPAGARPSPRRLSGLPPEPGPPRGPCPCCPCCQGADRPRRTAGQSRSAAARPRACAASSPRARALASPSRRRAPRR